MKCELCLGEKIEFDEIINEEGKFKILHCLNCGSISAKPLKIIKKTENFYFSQYQYDKYDKITSLTPHHRALLKKNKTYLEEINLIKKTFPKGKTIADMGCGIPFFLYFARQAGFSIYGFDIVSPFFHYVKSIFDITLTQKNTLQLAEENKTFDIVRYNHVFEHIYEIEKETEALSEIIHPGGLLIINVPNRNNWKENIKIYFKKLNIRDMTDPPHHYFSYSRKGLVRLMERFGFSLEKSFYSVSFQWGPKFLISFMDTHLIPKNYKADLNLIFRRQPTHA